jgi:hypothetical protein
MELFPWGKVPETWTWPGVRCARGYLLPRTGMVEL